MTKLSNQIALEKKSKKKQQTVWLRVLFKTQKLQARRVILKF